jgi:hypothetical protein
MELVFMLALTPALSPPSSLRFDAIAPKPKVEADGERESTSRCWTISRSSLQSPILCHLP